MDLGGRRLVRRGEVTRRQHAGEVNLEPFGHIRTLAPDPLDGLDQEHGRAGQDVDAVRRPAEQPPERGRAVLAVAQVGVQVPRMHDAEGIVQSSRRPAGERRLVETVRDHHDRSRGQLGKLGRAAEPPLPACS